MARKKKTTKTVSNSELARLSAQLRDNPQLFEKISEIVSMTDLTDSEIRPIDEVEGELVPKINDLGKQTLKSVCESVQDKVVQQQRSENKTLKMREKKR